MHFHPFSTHLVTSLNMDQVLLVDQSERFVFKPMLYELLSGGMFSGSNSEDLILCFFREFS